MVAGGSSDPETEVIRKYNNAVLQMSSFMRFDSCLPSNNISSSNYFGPYKKCILSPARATIGISFLACDLSPQILEQLVFCCVFLVSRVVLKTTVN